MHSGEQVDVGVDIFLLESRLGVGVAVAKPPWYVMGYFCNFSICHVNLALVYKYIGCNPNLNIVKNTDALPPVDVGNSVKQRKSLCRFYSSFIILLRNIHDSYHEIITSGNYGQHKYLIFIKNRKKPRS